MTYTAKEIAYYKGDGKFNYNMHIADEDDAYFAINAANNDFKNKKKRRELKDFETPAEFELYKITLYDKANEAVRKGDVV